MSHALLLFALTLTAADGPPAPTPPPIPSPTPTLSPVESWQLTLRDAIRIGLENSETVRLIEPLGQPAENPVIAPLGDAARGGLWRFKAEVMAEVRSIEQQYWTLAHQHVQLWSSQKSVELAEEILKREQSEQDAGIGRNGLADLAEIQQRLEQFRLELVTKTSDVITAERQLRRLLGLPPTDTRRIATITAATEAKVEPDWNSCLAAMREKQPDIARQKAAVELVEKKAAEAEATAALTARLGIEDLGPTPADLQRLREVVGRERAFLKQVNDQTTHSLARFFLEIDANYKQFQTAIRFRAAAAQRLEAQRAFYEEGRITVDRYLDAVTQYVSAVGQEAQFKSSYNISLLALEEAKGTLLEHDKITLADPPRPRTATVRDPGVKVTSFESTPAKSPEPAQVPQSGKTVSFQFRVGGGASPLEVRGSFTVAPSP